MKKSLIHFCKKCINGTCHFCGKPRTMYWIFKGVKHSSCDAPECNPTFSTQPEPTQEEKETKQ